MSACAAHLRKTQAAQPNHTRISNANRESESHNGITTESLNWIIHMNRQPHITSSQHQITHQNDTPKSRNTSIMHPNNQHRKCEKIVSCCILFIIHENDIPSSSSCQVHCEYTSAHWYLVRADGYVLFQALYGTCYQP